MKEVSKVDTRVIATPSNGAWIVECSEHGFLTVASDALVDRFLADHMHAAHGARVPA